MTASPALPTSSVSPALARLRDFRAVLFDLDGVLTPTADVHRTAWKETFDAFFSRRGGEDRLSEADYLRLIDGKPRLDGVRSVLADRGIELAEGSAEDAARGVESVQGLAEAKNAAFTAILERDGVAPYPGSLAFLSEAVGAGLEVAVVSSSRNAPAVLAAAGLAGHFDVVLDGAASQALGLAGKPAPDTYLAGAEALGFSPAQCIVIEDATSGVAAGRAGKAGLVISVARSDNAAELRAAGADLVVGDLGELVDPSRPQDAAHDAWSLTSAVEDRDPTPEEETIFALGNGFLGLRWEGPDGGRSKQGTFINGLYESWRIRYPENSYGQAEHGQTMIPAPDARGFTVYVNDEVLEMGRTEAERSETRLDFRDGTLTSTTVWRTAEGHRIEVRVRQMVSLEHRHLAVFEYQVRSLDADVQVHVRSTLIDPFGVEHVPSPAESDAASAEPEADTIDDPRKSEAVDGPTLRPVATRSLPDGREVIAMRTLASGMTVAAGTFHELRLPTGGERRSKRGTRRAPGRVDEWVDLKLLRGEAVRLTKMAAYHASRRQPVDEMIDRAQRTLAVARNLGSRALFAAQGRDAQAFWERSDVTVEGVAPSMQRAVRWNLWQLVQSAARADGLGVAAKGVSGNGYSGHYFWDAEVFVIPFLTYTSPQWARNALNARVNMLPKARERARMLSERGALFPWRTINGEEASAYFPAGTAQYHINADIASAIAHYIQATDDLEFLVRGGAEVLIETARMWCSLGFWRRTDAGRTFHLHGVTGPDEYTALVNDNTYTNVMAAFNLELAAEAVAQLEREDPDAFRRVVGQTKLRHDEVDEWREASAGMFIGFDEALGVHPQDDTFLEKEVWDIPGTPPEDHPLLLTHHPLVLYRFQVLKQADTVLALWLRSSRFTDEQKRADFEYYDPLTTGDSTLSATVQSIVAAEVGYQELAMDYFKHALEVDLANLHGNTADGVHVASTGGVWAALVHGFAGLRDDDGHWRFEPRLPAGWEALSFKLTRHGTRLCFRLTAEALTAVAEDGSSPVSFAVRGERVRVVPGDGPVTVPLSGQGPLLPGRPTFEAVASLQRGDGSSLAPFQAPAPSAGSAADDGDETDGSRANALASRPAQVRRSDDEAESVRP